ncbi:signal peptidase II [Gottschalkiaceae bacterium SANA]|nr:signal peptidase II [Gottschalkiaceae bacterium SANA]
MGWLLAITLIAIDQLSKIWASTSLAGQPAIPVIPGFFQLSYVRNFGAAFGILQNQRVIFLILTLTFVAGVVYVMKRYRFRTPFMIFVMGLTGGAVGNLIDRMFRGYVVDFFDVRFGQIYDFPVFNIADICIVVSTILIAIWVIFREEEIFVNEE